jgi:hypothetical protein
VDIIGQNVFVNLSGEKLTIEIDLAAETVPSKSEKTLLVASTRGDQKLPGTEWVLGLNLYRKP